MKRRRHTVGDAEFILEPISDSVIRVTHREQTGYFGLRGDWDPNRPYTWTEFESMVHGDGITMPMGMESMFSYSSSDAALNALCEAMLYDQRVADARRVNPEERKEAARRVMGEFLEEIPETSDEDVADADAGRRPRSWSDGPETPDPGLSVIQTADEEAPADEDQMVSVRIEDLCKIANSVATLMHDLDNGKYKHVHIEVDVIHEVVEKWATDASVLGDGCHDHRCRMCRQFGGYRPD